MCMSTTCPNNKSGVGADFLCNCKERINVEDVAKLMDEINRIRGLDLNKIDIYENDKKLDIPQKIIDNWKFIGLGTDYFIYDEFYKKEK